VIRAKGLGATANEQRHCVNLTTVRYVCCPFSNPEVYQKSTWLTNVPKNQSSFDTKRERTYAEPGAAETITTKFKRPHSKRVK
jgi:hypothetical protein